MGYVFGQRVETAVIETLSALGPGDWQRLADLAAKHNSGRLSREGWATAVDVVIERGISAAGSPKRANQPGSARE